MNLSNVSFSLAVSVPPGAVQSERADELTAAPPPGGVSSLSSLNFLCTFYRALLSAPGGKPGFGVSPVFLKYFCSSSGR